MAAEIGEGRSETEAMAELVSLMWERYIAPRAKKELLGHALDGYKAQVTANNGDGTLTVIRPFDDTAVTLRCPPGLAEEAEAGDQVLVVALGSMSNAFVLCRADLTGLGSGTPLTAELDFSGWDAGYFSETLDNGDNYVYLVEFDSSNRPVKIYDESHECTVIWE